MAEFEFRGHTARTYPGYQHPEREGVLQAEPGEIIEFGNASPPGDRQWYDVSSGGVYPPPPRVEGDEEDSAQEDSKDPEEYRGQ